MSSALKDIGLYDSLDDINFLRGLNGSLKEFNSSLVQDWNEDFPNIFILGAPRSGTTFLSQVIHEHLDVCTVNNLSSKFWEAPLVGAYFSKLLLKDKRESSFSSSYARTEVISDPHEFSYFWRNQLKIFDPGNYVPGNVKDSINWEELKNILLGINHIYGKPGLFKTLEYTGYFLEEFYQLFNKAIFIYIKRDPIHVAQSIYKAREKFNDDISEWWGSYPLEYKELRGEKVEAQIAGQIYYLDKLYEQQIAATDKKRIIRVNYTDLCESPQSVLDSIKKVMGEELNFSIDQLKKASNFTPSMPEVEFELKENFRLEFKKLNDK